MKKKERKKKEKTGIFGPSEPVCIFGCKNWLKQARALKYTYILNSLSLQRSFQKPCSLYLFHIYFYQFEEKS